MKSYGDYREFIKVIREAIEGRKVLQLLYHPRNQPAAARRINPYAVHLHNGSLYVIGHCHCRKDIITFVVDRMQKIKLTEKSFTLSPGFSVESYLRHSFGMFTEE